MPLYNGPMALVLNKVYAAYCIVLFFFNHFEIKFFTNIILLIISDSKNMATNRKNVPGEELRST